MSKGKQRRHRHEDNRRKQQQVQAVSLPDPFHALDLIGKRGVNKDRLAAQFRREY
nr:hypothetical protein [Hyphomonas sp. Mor2]